MTRRWPEAEICPRTTLRRRSCPCSACVWPTDEAWRAVEIKRDKKDAAEIQTNPAAP